MGMNSKNAVQFTVCGMTVHDSQTMKCHVLLRAKHTGSVHEIHDVIECLHGLRERH